MTTYINVLVISGLLRLKTLLVKENYIKFYYEILPEELAAL